MKTHKEMLICFISRDGRMFPEKKVTSLSLNEEVIIQKSIEYFNDPEPCMIHRSAVMNRIFAEIEEYFRKMLNNGENIINWDELPEHIRGAIHITGDILRVCLGLHQGTCRKT